jgi:hypothetical protein
MLPYSVVDRYQHFGQMCLCSQGEGICLKFNLYVEFLS